jgi:hypothetical protein
MKKKVILFAVLTLAIGFLIGMLTSAQIRYKKLKPMRLYFSEERFREGLYKTIEPDEKQKTEIEKILDKYASLNSELQGNFRKELDSNMKELRKELDSKLTKDQLSRLKDMDERRQEMIRDSGRNRNDSSEIHDRRERNSEPRRDHQQRDDMPLRDNGTTQPHPPPHSDSTGLSDSK